MKIRWRGCVVGVIFLVVTAPAFSQFLVEASTYFPLVDITSRYIFDDNSAGKHIKGEIPIPMKFRAPTGITAGTQFSNFFLGGEFAYFNVSTLTKDMTITTDETGTIGTGTIPDSVSSIEVTFWRIGAVCRYYFLTSRLRPFVGVAADFAYATVKDLFLPPKMEKFNVGMVEADVMAGLSFDVVFGFYLSIIARTGYCYTLLQGTVSDHFIAGDKMKISWEWAPVTVGLSVGYKF